MSSPALEGQKSRNHAQVVGKKAKKEREGKNE